MAEYKEAQRPARGDAITWFGHACFRVTDAEGHTVIVDPYVPQVMGQSLQGLTADVVIITHEHGDHNQAALIQTRHVIHGLQELADEGPTRVADAPTGIVFTLVPTYHDAAPDHPRGRNATFVWEQGGVTLCHLGDLCHHGSHRRSSPS